jgi:hypothetical protein
MCKRGTERREIERAREMSDENKDDERIVLVDLILFE